MGSAFHQLCPRYSWTLTTTAPMAIRLWETFTFSCYHDDLEEVVDQEEIAIMQQFYQCL